MAAVRSKLVDLSVEERGIWAAAYASAFMLEWERTYAAAQEPGASQARLRDWKPGDGQPDSPYDATCKMVTAEAAISRADLAVIRLREWRRDENPEAGFRLDEPAYRRIWPAR